MMVEQIISGNVLRRPGIRDGSQRRLGHAATKRSLDERYANTEGSWRAQTAPDQDPGEGDGN